MSDTRWGPDGTMGDVVRKLVGKKTDVVDRYLQLAARQPFGEGPGGLAPDPITDSLHFWADYLYERYGRPKWFVDREVFDLLTTLKVEDMDLMGIFFPHDVFRLIFEHGTMLCGKPLRSLHVFRPEAALTDKFCEELAPGQAQAAKKFFNAQDGKIKEKDSMMMLLVDAGENGFTKQYDWDTPLGMTCKLNERRRLRDPLNVKYSNFLNVNEEEAIYIDNAMRLFVSAMLYRAARPDCVAEYTLPRSCRYNYRGDKTTYRRMLCPIAPLREQRENAMPTGRTMKGHYRGWVLRTLRNERYKRNPDGTFKVVLVEPCAVKGGPESE